MREPSTREPSGGEHPVLHWFETDLLAREENLTGLATLMFHGEIKLKSEISGLLLVDRNRF